VEFGLLRTQVRPHVVHLGGHGVTMIAGAQGTGRLRPVNIGFHIPTINGERIRNVHHRWVQLCGESSTIGIGPGSVLLEAGISIDFVRQSIDRGFLRLGGSEQEFIANGCLPDSITRMETFVSENVFNPRVVTRVAVSLGENQIATNFVSYFHSDEFLLTMPQVWLAGMFALLPPQSGERLESRTVFIDCAETMQRLPIITLTFTAGGLRLLPEDYTRRTGQEEDTCELLIGQLPEWEAEGTIRFNPLLIPGINARSTENEIILCDSSVDL